MGTKSKHPSKFLNLVGWYGMLAILLGYALISFCNLSAHSFLYQGLMFTGASGIAAVAYARRDHQPMILNLVFALIALVSLLKLV